MRTVTFKSVLDRIAGYLAEADGLSTEDFALATAKVNLFIRLAWQHYWWPESMAVEKRMFRPAYATGETYAAQAQVYFLADHNYYQAMQAVPAGQAPATLNGTEYVPNLAYWFPCQSCYGGSDYASTGTYAVGNIVRNPDDDQFYGLYRLTYGVTVSGAGVTAANGIYVWDGEQYTAANGYSIQLRTTLNSVTHAITGYQWQLRDDTDTGLYTNTAGFTLPLPSPAGAWTTSFDPGFDPAPTVAITDPIAGQTPPFLPVYWTLLTPFIRSIDYDQDGKTALGLVRYIWNRDPETGTARPVPFRLRPDFVQVLRWEPVVWVEFQRRAPAFTSVLRSDEASYGAGVTLYDTATGDCWTTLEAVSPGETPTNAPSSWERVEFPEFLAEFVAQSAYAMLTNREQETPEDFTVQMAAGYPLLLAEMDNIERKQGQTRQLNVRTGR